MLPVYFVVGLMNIFAQTQNYGIKIEDPDFDIRVRRSIDVNQASILRDNNLQTDIFKREKRYAYYKKTTIPIDFKTYGNANNGSQTSKTIGNRYDIFNPNWNFLFNTTRNNSGINNVYNRPIIRSYPYGYPPGYGPNSASGNTGTTTPGYRNPNNAPYYFNYQNPSGKNFAGFVENPAKKSGYDTVTPGYNNAATGYNNIAPGYNNGASGYNNSATGYKNVTPGYDNVAPASNNSAPGYNNVVPAYDNIAPGYNNGAPGYNNFAPGYNSSAPGYNNVTPGYNNNYNNAPVPYAPRYWPNNTGTNYPPSYNNLAPYPINYTQQPTTINNTLPTNNTGIYDLPYAPNPVNNNNFNKDNLSPYAPNFAPTTINNGSATYNNTYATTNNTYATPSYVSLPATTTTEKITIATGCIICNIPCPQFMRRFGGLCLPENNDDDY